MEEQFNKEAKEGWRSAADAARITDKRAGSEDQQHTSGGVFVAVDSNLGAVVGEKEGAVTSIPGNEGRTIQAWVNVRGGMRVFAAYFWHTDGKVRPQETKPFWMRCCREPESPDIHGWQHVTLI